MKRRKKELDVDFIGGAEPLTKEEEKLISDFIKSRKAKRKVATKKKSDSIAAQLLIKKFKQCRGDVKILRYSFLNSFGHGYSDTVLKPATV